MNQVFLYTIVGTIALTVILSLRFVCEEVVKMAEARDIDILPIFFGSMMTGGTGWIITTIHLPLAKIVGTIVLIPSIIIETAIAVLLLGGLLGYLAEGVGRLLAGFGIEAGHFMTRVFNRLVRHRTNINTIAT